MKEDNALIFRINTMLFPGGKRKALTLSYDDGVAQDRRFVKLLNRYGVKCTFNLNTGRLGRTGDVELEGKVIDGSMIRKEEIAELYAGHEVSTHSENHTSLVGCGSTALCEILEDRKVLESLVPYLVRGHAYPFGFYDENTMAMLKAAGICHARTVFSSGNFDLPKNFLEWHPTCHHNDPKMMELAKLFCEQDAIFGQPQLFYLWGHTYEFDIAENWNVIEKFLSYIVEHQDKIWMATNIDIVEYVTAYKNLLFSADGTKVYNPSVHTVWLESSGEIYQIPANGMITL